VRETDRAAALMSKDSQKIDEFISDHNFFILRTVSKTAKRYVSKNDDEYSVALYAFYDAVKKYDYNKGSFYSFAELIIRRSLIDYYRAQQRYAAEICIEEFDENTNVHICYDNDLRLEIEAINGVLKIYGISFFELAKCSPKAKKTKEACKTAINFLLNSPLLIKEMRDTKQLPIKIIENNTHISRKILERHRKYIIAAAEILYGEYTGLAEYLSYVRKGI